MSAEMRTASELAPALRAEAEDVRYNSRGVRTFRRVVHMFKRSVIYVLCAAMLNLGSPMMANAGMIGTLQAVESSTRAGDLSIVASALARDEVRQQFVSLGVDPARVDTRIAALTDSELRTLAGQMSELPAGGDALAIIGIVFLVLMILEAVGVIDIFKKFP
jgi:hypothetical protein